MGTRSLTIVKNTEKGKDIIVMYRQFDGYPSGHGEELKEFLSPFTVVNGITGETKKIKAANGAGCLAAQLVEHFKNHQVGNIYLEPSGTRDCGEQYIYTIWPETKRAKGWDKKMFDQPTGRIMLKVQCGSVTYFGLPGTKQKNMPVIFQGPVAEFNAESAAKAEEKLRADIPNDYLDEGKAKAEKVKA